MSYSFHINFNKAVPAFAEFFPEALVQTTNKQITSQEFFREECSEIKINRNGNQYGDNETIYDTLETWFFDDTKFSDEIEIEIYRGTIGGGTLYFAGFFSISDGVIDRERKTFKITPRVDDSYRTIMELRGVRYNIRTGTGVTILAQEDIVAPIPQAITWNAGSPSGGIPDFAVFTTGATDEIITQAVDNSVPNQAARYHILIGSPANGDIVTVRIVNYTLNGGSNPLIDVVDNADASMTAEGGTAITGDGDYVFNINAGAGAYNLMIYTFPAGLQTDFETDIYISLDSDGVSSGAGALYIDFIDDFITNVGFMSIPGLNIKSTYLKNDALPSDAPSTIDTFITANPNGNYVTLNTTNPLNGFIVSETRRWVDADVTEILVSFNDLMSDMMHSHQIGWYIDADGDFRLEHVKYFELLRTDSTALDLTGAPFTKYKPETDAKELTMNKALLANREQFEWQQAGDVDSSEDFVGVDIIYENLETIENVFRHEPRRVTTDYEYLVDNASSASADGLLFLQCFLSSGDYFIQNEIGVLSGDNKVNGHFSWANLQDKYWTWRRMSENGDMNDGDTVAFDSAVKFLEQANVRFGHQSTLDPYTKITTSQGTGQQTEVIRDLDTDFITMLISYNPYA